MTTKTKVAHFFLGLVLFLSYTACQCKIQNTVQTKNRTDDVELFDRLTNHMWCDKQNTEQIIQGQSPLSEYRYKNYGFSRNGTYNYLHMYVSDYRSVEDEGNGDWNFQKTSKDSGIINLASRQTVISDSVLQFSFDEDGNLTIADLFLYDCGEINYNQQQQTAIVDQLPDVQPPEIFSKLFRNRWKKANQFDLFILPTQIAFQANGSYTASFRNGECSFTDVFSVRKGDLITRTPENNCDERISYYDKSHGSTSRYPVRFKNEFLIFQDNLYVPENYELAGGMEWIGDTKIRFDSVIKSNVAVPMTIELKNDNPNKDPITSFSVSEQPVKKTAYGYTPLGKEKILSIVDFSSSAVESGQTRAFEINPIFTVRGSNSISFIFTNRINNKPFQSRKTFILDLQ